MPEPRLPRARAGVFSTEIYRPGRPLGEVLAEYGLDRAIKLASNENLFGSSPRALAALKAACDDVAYYPDTNGVALCRRISARCDLPTEQVVLGNGTVELIYDLIRAYVDPGDEVVMGRPSFSAYPIATRLQGGVPVEVPLTTDQRLDLPALAAAVTPKTKIVFVPNPNNPTGTLVGRGAVDRLLADLPPGVLVVLDEAYHDYVQAEDYPDSEALLRGGAPVMVLRSLSKSLGIAGVRIGYGLAPAEVARVLRQVQVPFHCSGPAQAAAAAGLEDREFVVKTRVALTRAREFLAEEFAARDLEPVPSHANFMVFRAPVDAPAPALAEALLRRGVIIRPGENLGAPGWIRVTVGPIPLMREFLAAFDEARRELRGE